MPTVYLPLSDAQLIFLGLLFGMIIGSFLSMLSYRLPRHLLGQWQQQLDEERTLTSSIESPQALTQIPSSTQQPLSEINLSNRSQCPHCLHTLRWWQLIPILGWLLQRGHCHDCHAPISWRYPVTELITALLSGAVLWKFGLTDTGLIALGLTWTLILITIIDLEHHLIFDVISLPLVWIGLLLNLNQTFAPLEQAVMGAVAGYLILWLVFHLFKLATGKEGMGYGDFKLLAALGAWFGIMALAEIILWASISSLIIGSLLLIMKNRGWQQEIAFGPYLALAGWIALMTTTA